MSDSDEFRAQVEEHRRRIETALAKFADQLNDRARRHDLSKLEEPQFSAFSNHPRDRAIAYGSDKYMARLEVLGEALDHHYSIERHHPEFHEDGINGMTLVDLVEMFVDWHITWSEHGAGAFREVIDLNRTRFGISDQLVEILLNTAAQQATASE
ncbi:MAG: hypothetical protein J0H98_10730 [Solirubrobacterales bacterium]|nr:hypothetical protein [Solirubrobacterales bacterium]